MHFTSDPFSIAAVTGQLIEKVAVISPTPDALANIEIVVTEVINNIIEHAYQDRPDQPIEMSARSTADSIQFDLVDCGRQMPDCRLPEGATRKLPDAVAELPEGGFGWHIIRSLTENLKYSRISGENHLSFSVTIGPTQSVG